ncbi:hypothetical protein ACSBR2_007985 [Camellia fascicularis]
MEVKMPTTSLLTDLSRLPPKRQFDHSGCQYWGFPPNFKRPKFDAIRDFPKHFGATGNSKIGEEWVVSVKPSEISVTSDMKSESTEPMVSSHDNVEELPTMSLLPDERPLSKLPGKILFDLGGCQRRGFPPNFKRPKVDAIRDIPRHCCVLTPQITEKPSECISVVATTGDSKVGEEGAVVPVKPSGISKPSDVKSESTTAAVAGEKVVLKTPDDPKLTNVTENLAEAKSIDTLDILKLLSLPRPLVRKYPPVKIRKGIPVYRTYPPGCRMLNHASKSKILVNKSSVEHRPLVETTTVGKQFEVQILDVHGFERNLEVNALKEMADKVQAKSTEIIGSESCKQIQSRTSSEFKVKQDNKVETSNVSPSEIILLPPDSMCQTVNTKIKEDNGLVGRTGKELEEYCEDTDAKDGSDMVIWSQVAQHFDLKPLSCDWAIAKQEGEWVFNCEPLEATCGYKIQNHEVYDASKSNYVLLQNQDIAEAYKQDYTKENSLFLSEEAANQYEDTPFDDEENHKHIVAKESNVLSIVPFDDIQAIDSQNKVREALDLFDEIFTKILEEHEAQSKEKGNAAKQIHVEAANLLKKQQKWVNTERLLGPVPGVEVGHKFRFRAELLVIGLHHQFQSGIDYMKKDGKIFATSIVASGRYANDVGSPDVLKYCGQGGNPTSGCKEPKDQKLERGNLALKNSMDAGTPVRVIRGRQNLKSSNILGRYVYDGLYIVASCKQERGEYGKLVFMFHLNRIPGQPKLTPEILSMSAKSKVRELHSGVDDISQGKEKMPIHVVNTMDDEKPPPFVYITNMIYPEWYNRAIRIGCDCKNGCSYSKKCLCTIKNGGDNPFNCNGAIVELKPLVYECGPSCKCSSFCKNRVSQHGIRYQLEVFKTESRGWGVRSRNYISSGNFICEYVGELLHDKEAEQRGDNDDYLFDVGHGNDDNFPQDEALDDDGFTIDAMHFGNVGRFINHSCSPNLCAQNVLYDHDDKRMPHIMFFATRGIFPLQELTYDYNYKLDQVRDVNGNIKKKNCYCGSLECCGRMY